MSQLAMTLPYEKFSKMRIVWEYNWMPYIKIQIAEIETPSDSENAIYDMRHSLSIERGK